MGMACYRFLLGLFVTYVLFSLMNLFFSLKHYTSNNVLMGWLQIFLQNLLLPCCFWRQMRCLRNNFFISLSQNGDGCLSLEELMSHSKFIATKLRLQWRVENCHPGYPLGRKLSAAQVPYADSELIITEHEEKSTSASETENQKPTKSI